MAQWSAESLHSNAARLLLPSIHITTVERKTEADLALRTGYPRTSYMVTSIAFGHYLEGTIDFAVATVAHHWFHITGQADVAVCHLRPWQMWSSACLGSGRASSSLFAASLALLAKQVG